MHTEFAKEFPSAPSIRGWLHEAAGHVRGGMALTHGAGGNCNSLLLIELAEALAGLGISVLRCDLPFRQKRPQGPPRPGEAEVDREGLRRAVEALRMVVVGPIFLGGHSYGGRQATILASEDSSVCDALLLLSYPLHPPRKPEQLRTGHFPALRAPAMFVHGSTDGFGTLEE